MISYYNLCSLILFILLFNFNLFYRFRLSTSAPKWFNIKKRVVVKVGIVIASSKMKVRQVLYKIDVLWSIFFCIEFHTSKKCFSIIYKIECFHSHLTKLFSCLCRFIFMFGGEISKDWSSTCNEREKKKKKLTWLFSFAIIHMFLWCEWSLLDTPLYLFGSPIVFVRAFSIGKLFFTKHIFV